MPQSKTFDSERSDSSYGKAQGVLPCFDPKSFFIKLAPHTKQSILLQYCEDFTGHFYNCHWRDFGVILSLAQFVHMRRISSSGDSAWLTSSGSSG